MVSHPQTLYEKAYLKSASCKTYVMIFFDFFGSRHQKFRCTRFELSGISLTVLCFLYGIMQFQWVLNAFIRSLRHVGRKNPIEKKISCM